MPSSRKPWTEAEELIVETYIKDYSDSGAMSVHNLADVRDLLHVINQVTLTDRSFAAYASRWAAQRHLRSILNTPTFNALRCTVNRLVEMEKQDARTRAYPVAAE